MLIAICWALFLVTDYVSIVVSEKYGSYANTVILNLFIVSIYLLFRVKYYNSKTLLIYDLIERIFRIALVLISLVLLQKIAFMLFSKHETFLNAFLLDISYNLLFLVVALFGTYTFFAWKRLVMYQKNKNLIQAWYILEIGLLILLIYNAFDTDYRSPVNIVLVSILIFYIFILSFNLKWIPYQDNTNKVRLILMLAFIFVFTAILIEEVYVISMRADAVFKITESLILFVLIAFVGIYSFLSFLVLIFNLPTSSVFDRKFDQVVNFQRLNQKLQIRTSEEEIYNMLLENCIESTNSSAAWVEINDHENLKSEYKTYSLSKTSAKGIKSKLLNSITFESTDRIFETNINMNDFIIHETKFRSMVLFHIRSGINLYGIIALLKDFEDGYDNEAIELVKTFCSQVALTIQNVNLLKETLKGERYNEEIKIAQRVQESLLPKSFPKVFDFSVSFYSEASADVGGDYYDYFRINEDKMAVVIGDVSGKGTSAAFHMSQMKGIFQSLVQMDLSPNVFMEYANSALQRSLEASSFITLSYFIIDTKEKKVSCSRAGHVPSLYYSKENDSVSKIEGKGMGLSLADLPNFADMTEVIQFSYSDGDALLLYTDGIVESKNEAKEEYGFERLENQFKGYIQEKPEIMVNEIIRDMFSFAGGSTIDDDFTLMVIKFGSLEQ